jgi:hypothetical protein
LPFSGPENCPARPAKKAAQKNTAAVHGTRNFTCRADTKLRKSYHIFTAPEPAGKHPFTSGPFSDISSNLIVLLSNQ